MPHLILYNILKHKFLFLLMGLIVAVFTLYLIIGLNALFSVTGSLKNGVARHLSGDCIITSTNARVVDILFKDGEKKMVFLDDWREILGFLDTRDYVTAAAPRLRKWGRVMSSNNVIPMIITGVDVEREKALLPDRVLDEGRWLSNGSEVMMYYRHSDHLDMKVGDEVSIAVTTLDRYQNLDMARLSGVFDYKELGVYTEFAFYAFVPLDFLNRLILTNQTCAGEIFVRLKGPEYFPRLEKDVAEKFGAGLRFIPPERSATLVGNIHKLTLFTVVFIAAVLLVMVYLCSSYLVNLAIETRRREIGVYQALGVRKWRVGLLFGGEFLVVMALCGLAGAAAALALMGGLSKTGIYASIMPLQMIFGCKVLYVQNSAVAYLTAFGVLLATFAANTVTAIVKMARLDPVALMREL